jgi:hypothetical protein
LKINKFFSRPEKRITMASQNQTEKKLIASKIGLKSIIRIFLVFSILSVMVAGAGNARADALDYLSPWSVGFESMYSWIDGQMGFDQTATGYGSINNLKNDLGLPDFNQTYRIYATMRPLEHHMIRVFGTIPEYYQGDIRPQWDLRLTHLPSAFNANAGQTTNDRVIVFPAGTLVKSQMRTAQFGFGYDLDFVLGPGHAAGLQGELRYIDLRVTISNRDAYSVPGGEAQTVPPLPRTALTEIGYQTNLISLDELAPCLGAHAQAVFPFGFGKMFPQMTLGGYTRMNFSLYPGYLNYVDVQAGLQLVTCPTACDRRFLAAKFGFEHESIFHDGQARAGRVLELKRDGLTCSLEAIF